jgi:integrase/recombinase XerD
MTDATRPIAIVCPHCGQQYPASWAEPGNWEQAEDTNLIDASFTTYCPHCGGLADIRTLNALTMRAAVVYLDYTIYPDLIEHYLPPIDQNAAAVYLYSLTSDRSRRVMTQALRTVASLLTGQDARSADILAIRWGAMRYPHTAALRARLSEIYSPATANRTLSALRGVLKEAWRLGQMSAEDYQRAVDIQNIKGETVPAGRELSTGEILALVTICKNDQSYAGVRDASIIGLLYTCGLRRAELVALDVSDVDRESGRLLVRAGKGRKQRTVYAQGGALRALTDWLDKGGREKGPLFVPVLKGNRITPRRMNAQSIYDMLKKRALEAGVNEFSPHDMRRTFVGEMLERGVDIATVANIAGHASVDTTRRYDRRPEETKKRAAGKLHFPY